MVIIIMCDDDSAKDSLQFLIRWLDRFPRYKGREIYLTGESYAGHYVPQLAREILIYNKQHSNTPLNLKGIMVNISINLQRVDKLSSTIFHMTARKN